MLELVTSVSLSRPQSIRTEEFVVELQFIPGGDIALYAVLTSLACFDRAQLRTRVLENSNLRPFLDLEPYLRDIVRAFYDSKFKHGLELLAKYEVRFLLSPL